MRVRVDNAKCTGHARCNAVGPDVFPLDDVGYCAVRGAVDVAPGLEPQARDGAAACPERAIEIEE
jgi:ferredoxin